LPIAREGVQVQARQIHVRRLGGGIESAEMALPNHPDVAYAFVKTLKDCGYQWVLVQEHSVEQLDNGWHPQRPHLPHRLVCANLGAGLRERSRPHGRGQRVLKPRIPPRESPAARGTILVALPGVS